VDAEGWGSWLLGEGSAEEDAAVEALAEEARVLAAWAVPWATARGMVSGFVKSRPELLHKMPALGHADVSRAWPSPRTWEMATRAWTSGEVHNLSASDREEFMSAFVGVGVTSEFMSYIEHMDLPNPADLLDGKAKFKHDPKRLDRTAAVLGACYALVSPVGAENRRPRAAKLWEIIGAKELVDDAVDVAFQATRGLVKAKLFTMKEAYVVLEKMLPVLEAAGIRFDPKAVGNKSGYDD
jgi:hypothetical protein